MAMARDGSIQLGFGMGKYTNRNVHRRLRRGVARAGASGRCEPAGASPPIRSPPSSRRCATRCSSRMRVVRFALDANDVLPGRVRVDVRGRAAARARGPHGAPGRVPHVGRPRPLPPDRGGLRLGGGRGRADRARHRRLRLDPRPLVGGALRRGRAAAGRRRRSTRSRASASRWCGARCCSSATTALATGCSSTSRSSPRPASASCTRSSWVGSSIRTARSSRGSTSRRS